MKRISELKFLFVLAWNKGKSLFFIVLAQNIFSAVLPLINIAGLGMVIDALTTNKTKSIIVSVIVKYLSINLCVSIISGLLNHFQFMGERKVSNIMQFDYAKDSLNIDYHYVQDRSILNLKQKSMSVNPALSLSQFGRLINYIVQFTGIIYIFWHLSPIFIVVLVVTCTLSISLTFRKRRFHYAWQKNRVENDRKLNYIYRVMSEYRFAKEVRLNNVSEHMEDKYENVLAEQIGKMQRYYKDILNKSLLSVAITNFQSAAMYLYFSFQVFSGQITVADYTILLGATTLLISILLGFFDNIAQLRNLCSDVALYAEYAEKVEKNSNISKSNNLPKRTIDFTDVSIKFENVSFVYPGTERLILDNINLEIKKD